MSSHRILPTGRTSIDPFHGDLISARGATKRMLAVIDDMDYRGRYDAGRLREVAGLAEMVQRRMGAWADEMERGDADGD